MLDPAVIAATLAELGEPAYRARQIYEALTRGLVTDFAAVTTLPSPLRRVLAERLAVVALTAYASGEDRQHFLDAGMDEAVAKPAEEEALMAAMRRALDVARQRAAQQDSSPKKEHAP